MLKKKSVKKVRAFDLRETNPKKRRAFCEQLLPRLKLGKAGVLLQPTLCESQFRNTYEQKNVFLLCAAEKVVHWLTCDTHTTASHGHTDTQRGSIVA